MEGLRERVQNFTNTLKTYSKTQVQVATVSSSEKWSLQLKQIVIGKFEPFYRDFIQELERIAEYGERFGEIVNGVHETLGTVTQIYGSD